MFFPSQRNGSCKRRICADVSADFIPNFYDMSFNQRGDISSVNGRSLKLVDKFTLLGSGVSSIETDINMWLAKAWTTINKLSVIWKPDLTDKMKQFFFFFK